MKFGVRGHDIEADTIESLIERCEELNIKSVQLALKKTVKGFKEGMFSPSYAAEMGRKFKEKGIEVSILGCYINPSNTHPEELKKELDFFVECLKYAKFMDAGMVALETGFVGESCEIEPNSTEHAYEYLLKNMRYLCDAAEKLGVMIGIEAVYLYVINSMQKMKRLVDDLNSPNVCVVFDPLNLVTLENHKNTKEIVEEAFELLGDKIAAVHLKDFTLEGEKFDYALPGTGNLDVKHLLSIVKETKPHLPVILEQIPEKEYKNVVENLEKLMSE